MMLWDRQIVQTAALLALFWIAPAAAQDILSANKSPAQIFASDRALCHKTPQPLAKAGGPLGLGLQGFLRSHYTASSQTASIMAKYIQSFESAPAAAEKGARRGAIGAKASARKADSKRGEAKPAEAKPVEATKPVEPKSE